MEPVFYIKQPVEFRLEGGLVYADLKSGDQIIHVVGSLNTFLETNRNMAAIVTRWRAGMAEIVEFDRAAH